MIQVDGGLQSTDSTALSPGQNSSARHRVLFHEAVHYWQQLSQGFLVKLADEEWARLKAYEEKGDMASAGPIRREFERHDPVTGCSARDLHECLARYWEIVAFGPAKVIKREWQLDRTAVHPDFQQAWTESQRLSGTPEGASGFADLFMAMLMIGGEYATPFIDACQRFGHSGAFVFPWLAHLALTTDRPTASYATLTDECGQRLADEVANILRDSRVPLTEQYDSTMVELADLAHLAFLRTLPHDSMTGYGMTAYAQSRLDTNPAHAATFKGIATAANALATTETVQAIARRWGWDEGSRKGEFPEGLFLEGLRLLEGAMATPGLHMSRTLLLTAGLAPAVGYSNGALLPLRMVWRTQALARAEELSEVDLTRVLVELASRPSADDEDRIVTALSAKTQARWDAFVRAARDHNRVAHVPGGRSAE